MSSQGRRTTIATASLLDRPCVVVSDFDWSGSWGAASGFGSFDGSRRRRISDGRDCDKDANDISNVRPHHDSELSCSIVCTERVSHPVAIVGPLHVGSKDFGFGLGRIQPRRRFGGSHISSIQGTRLVVDQCQPRHLPQPSVVATVRHGFTFYYATNGDRSWLNNTGWLSDDDECTTWHQITLAPTSICDRRSFWTGPSRPKRYSCPNCAPSCCRETSCGVPSHPHWLPD